MTMSGPELTTWRDDAAARRDAAAALVAAEQARDPGGAMQEQFLRSCNIGHLMSRVIELGFSSRASARAEAPRDVTRALNPFSWASS